MRNAGLKEAQAGIKLAGRNLNNLRYADDTTLMAESEVKWSFSVVSDCLQPHGLQHARLLCPSPSPRVCTNSCLLSRWWPPNHLILCHPLLLPSIFPSIRVFSSELALRIRWPKYWSFSFSPSNEYSVLISSRIDWFDLLAVQWTQESSPTPQFKSINSSGLSFLYNPTLTSIHDHWKNHRFD